MNITLDEKYLKSLLEDADLCTQQRYPWQKYIWALGDNWQVNLTVQKTQARAASNAKIQGMGTGWRQ